MDAADIFQKSLALPPEANVWRETYQVRSYEVDCCNRLSILSIFNFMQEAASRHAEALGVSIHQLLAENYTWLLSRLNIKIASFPGWKNQIQVSTWPSGTQQLFALRDFELQDNDGHTIAAAVSAWLVIDLEKRRPVRIGPFVERLKPVEGGHILPDRLDKLAPLRDHSRERSFVVRHADLDINQHVNNVSFVEWVLESVPSAVLNTAVPVEFEINFLAEAFYDDQIRAACHPQSRQPREFLHSLIRRQDGRELARARTIWQEVKNQPSEV